ncbi:hypothetical protein FVB9288_01625 [Flavobacterium sp. CECT 9288]|nr:hypothetical protein FVB9288_01625 [Flavobacterium sp. CECT 9288]
MFGHFFLIKRENYFVLVIILDDLSKLEAIITSDN